jgi:hypothetical protein
MMNWEKWYTNDEKYFIDTLLTCDLKRINRLRQQCHMPEIGRAGLLSLYIQTAKEREWPSPVDGDECIKHAQMRAGELILKQEAA